jgi:uncharacterized protein (TIGR02246 family)
MRYMGSTASTLLLSLAITTSNVVAQDAPPRALKNKPTPKSEGEAPEAAAIRGQSQAFVEAFNKKDSKAVVEFWTPEGEYIDEDGIILQGRNAIEDRYKEFFKEKSDAKLRLAIDSIRVLGASAAIEEGQSFVEPAPLGATGIHRYTAVYLKVDGKWRMASLRDTWEESPSENSHLADLEFLVGTWAAEEHGARSESTCRWIAGKNFVERQYSTKHADGTTVSGLQIIGWDPQVGSIRSWNFSPDGGHAVGIWSPIDGGWRAEMQGTTGDGRATSATNVLMRLDDNAYMWQSTQRQVDGQSIPDTEEVVIKRQKTAAVAKK